MRASSLSSKDSLTGQRSPWGPSWAPSIASSALGITCPATPRAWADLHCNVSVMCESIPQDETCFGALWPSLYGVPGYTYYTNHALHEHSASEHNAHAHPPTRRQRGHQRVTALSIPYTITVKCKCAIDISYNEILIKARKSPSSVNVVVCTVTDRADAAYERRE